MATRRSKALQLFVYMSRTSARGTSAFLEEKKRRLKIENLSKCWDIPVVHHGDIFPFFSCILSRMRE